MTHVHKLSGAEAMAALARLPLPQSRRSFGSCVILHNPFDPFEREIHAVIEPMRVLDLAARYSVDPTASAVVCRVNGKWCLQKSWGIVWAGPGSVIEFHYLVRGGGNLLRSALLLALAVAATAVAGPVGGFIGASLFTAGTTAAVAAGAVATAIVGASIIAGGTFAINALLPPQKSAAAGSRAFSGSDSASPTYTLGLQNNQARLGQPIPVQYGRHIVYPDYAAAPYVVAIDNDQYLRAVMVVGQGEYDVESVNIGTTPISNFPGQTYQIVEPGDGISLFNPFVYQAKEVSGQTLLATNESGHDWIGPFAACAPGQVINAVEVDITWPQGLSAFLSDGSATPTQVFFEVQARVIDDDGNPLGDWIVLTEEEVTTAIISPIYRTYGYAVVSGRYETRCRRTNEVADNISRTTTTWAALKGYLVGPSSFFGDVTVLAVQIKVTNSLAPSTSNIFNVIGTRKLPIWNGSSWSVPTATRSIAWALADACRSTTYGAAMSDDQIDLAALLVLDAIWAARGDTFDGVFDQQITNAEVRSTIARAGRARPYHQAGMLRFYRDGDNPLPVTMFSASSINLDSFQLEFALPVTGEIADGVRAEYFDSALWKPRTVTAGVDSEEPEDVAEMQLVGVTSVAHAQREADYEAAVNRYRRVFVSFSTEMAGMIPSMGDPILLAHDVPEFGQSGDVLSYDTSSRVMRLQAETEMDPAYTWTVTLRDQLGDCSKTIECVPGVVGDRIVLQGDPEYPDGSPFTVVVDDDREPTHFAVGRSSKAPQLVIVTNIAPRGRGAIQIQGVVEDARVHVN